MNDKPIPPFMLPREVPHRQTPFQDMLAKTGQLPTRDEQLDDLEEQIAAHARQGTQPIDTIREAIKRLTHRQMRQLCDDIFKARGVAKGQDSVDGISKQELPDVLDKFAYGD